MLECSPALGAQVGFFDFELRVIRVMVEFPQHPVFSTLPQVVRGFPWSCHDVLTPEVTDGACSKEALIKLGLPPHDFSALSTIRWMSPFFIDMATDS